MSRTPLLALVLLASLTMPVACVSKSAGRPEAADAMHAFSVGDPELPGGDVEARVFGEVEGVESGVSDEGAWHSREDTTLVFIDGGFSVRTAPLGEPSEPTSEQAVAAAEGFARLFGGVPEGAGPPVVAADTASGGLTVTWTRRIGRVEMAGDPDRIRVELTEGIPSGFVRRWRAVRQVDETVTPVPFERVRPLGPETSETPIVASRRLVHYTWRPNGAEAVSEPAWELVSGSGQVTHYSAKDGRVLGITAAQAVFAVLKQELNRLKFVVRDGEDWLVHFGTLRNGAVVEHEVLVDGATGDHPEVFMLE